MMMKYIPLLMLIFFGCQAQDTSIKTINHNQLQEVLKTENIQLVDVRTAEEYQQGHIKNAMNFDITQTSKFMEDIKKLDPKKPIYLYCRSGNRSHKAALQLQKIGFTTIYDYSEGYKGWISKQNK